jgi:hypothetical protein
MRTTTKVGLVVAGYVVAVLLALAVVAIHDAFMSGPGSQGGMAAFGDSLLFLAVFGVSAVPPTSAALYFLRSHRSFWPPLSVTALVIAATGLAALIDYLGARGDGTGPLFGSWSAFAVLRILVAPLFALAFLLSGVFAPNRSSRIALLLATGIEGSVFAYIALLWFQSIRSH